MQNEYKQQNLQFTDELTGIKKTHLQVHYSTTCTLQEFLAFLSEDTYLPIINQENHTELNDLLNDALSLKQELQTTKITNVDNL